MSSYRLVLCVSLLFLTASVLEAQDAATGAIAGEVHDPSGARIPQARLSVASEQTGLARVVTTTSQGFYRVSLLPPGDYSIEVDVPGFERKTLRSIRVVASETAVARRAQPRSGQNSIAGRGFHWAGRSTHSGAPRSESAWP